MNWVKLTVYALTVASFPSAAFANVPPQALWPGILTIQNDKNGPEYISEEVNGQATYLQIKDLPLDIFKDRPETERHTNQIACANPAPNYRCILDLSFDGKKEYWLFDRNTENGMVKALQIPLTSPADFNILSSSNFFGAKDASYAFTSVNEDRQLSEMIVEIPNHANGLVRKLIKQNEFALPRPTRSSSNIRAVFAIYPKKKQILLNDIIAIEIVNADGQFIRSEVPTGCIFLGVMNDKPLCASAVPIEIPKNDEENFINITAPLNSIADIYQRFDNNFVFAAIKDKAFLSALRGGTKRPFFYDVINKEKKWLFTDNSEKCLGQSINADVVGVTANEDGLMIRTSGLLSPVNMQIVAFDGNPIDFCNINKRTVFREDSEFNNAGYSVERVAQYDDSLPPYVLVKGKPNGWLSGRLLVFSYGHHGFTIPEAYSSSWGKHWLENGGNIALAHLPGSGGYGEEWIAKGTGIRGKITAAQYLDRLTDNLIANGYGEHGKVSLSSESAGGPTVSYAALIKPAKYESVILRAACLDIDLDVMENCSISNDYGDANDKEDRQIAQQFELTKRINALDKSPLFIFGLPEYDNTVKKTYQQSMITKLSLDRRSFMHLIGVHHTDRMSVIDEEKWVKRIITDIMNRTEDR